MNLSYVFQEGEHGLDEHKLHLYLSALQSLIPSLFALVLQNAPFTSKAKLQGDVPQIEGTQFKQFNERLFSLQTRYRY